MSRVILSAVVALVCLLASIAFISGETAASGVGDTVAPLAAAAMTTSRAVSELMTQTVSGPFVQGPITPTVLDVDLRELPQVDLPPAAPLLPNEPQGAMPAPAINVPGLNSSWNTGYPAYPNAAPSGDIGSTYYIQAVNSALAIYVKQTGARVAAVTFKDLFSGDDEYCHFYVAGNSNVLYDSLADRWLVAFTAYWQNSDSGPDYFRQCIAVSRTSDPVTGGWYRYVLGIWPDWWQEKPRFSLWPDAYYLAADTYNDRNWPIYYNRPRVWALDRLSMLNGGPLNAVAFDLPTTYHDVRPANLRGEPPWSGTPNWLAAVDQDWNGSDDVLHLWQFHVDWSFPQRSVVTGPLDIVVAPFVIPTTSIPQLGSSEQLQSQGQGLMSPLQYRNIHGVESLWTNHTISTGGVTGIRWYEVRGLNSTPFVYQQGTHQPDAKYRWLGSLAVDHDGNMALGYSVSSASMYPAIRYAGRLATDPLGTLPQTETSLVEGTGSQTGGIGVWGDFSAMSVSPESDCTFWFTNEYYTSTGFYNWQTRIGSARFPSCLKKPQGSLTGTVSSALTGQPLTPTQVTASRSPTQVYETRSDAAGHYGFRFLPVGTYTLTARAYGYLPTDIANVPIVTDTSTLRNIVLNPAPQHVVSGVITDSDFGVPLWATVHVYGYPFHPPTATAQSDPETGFYSLTVPGGQSYALDVEAPLHAHEERDLIELSSNRTENFALSAITTTSGLIGLVRDPYSKQPLAGAQVAIDADEGWLGTTNSQGYFQILGVPPGVYTITARYPAADPLYVEITLTDIPVLTATASFRTIDLLTSRLNFSPASLSRTLLFGTVVTDDAALIITNTGLSTLTYQLVVPSMLAAPTLLPYPHHGGPDSFGYRWHSSAAPDGPQFDWIDATHGQLLNLSRNGEVNVTLPFSFAFYGVTSTQLRIGMNGAVLFNTTSGEIDPQNHAITDTLTPDYFLAPFWADLTSNRGSVYTTVIGTAPQRRFVIEWYNVSDLMEGATFELVLFENGDILHQYLDTSFWYWDNRGDGRIASVGLRGPDSTQSLPYSFRAPRVPNYFAICFTLSSDGTPCRVRNRLPWLTNSPASGDLAGGITSTVVVQSSWNAATPLVPEPGVYTGTLQIRNNASTGQNTYLPVTMTVTTPPTYGKVTGRMQTTGICAENPAPLPAVAVHLAGTDGFQLDLPTDDNGRYRYWLDQGDYTVTVAAAGNLTQVTVLSITSGLTTTQDFDLRLEQPCLRTAPSRIDVKHGSEVITVSLTISNTGPVPLDFSVCEVPISNFSAGPAQIDWPSTQLQTAADGVVPFNAKPLACATDVAWLSVTPETGVGITDSQTLQVLVDPTAAGSPLNTYAAQLLFQHNTPQAVVQVPVTLYPPYRSLLPIILKMH